MNSLVTFTKSSQELHIHPCSNSSNAYIQEELSPNISVNMQNRDESIAHYYEIFKYIVKSKEEATMLKEIHDEMFDIYIDKMNYISNKTAKSYSKIISKFMIYSPSIDPYDLDKFILCEFNLKNTEEAQQSKLKGTTLKYYNWIYSFLKHVYISHFSALHPEFSKDIKESSIQKDDFPSLFEVINS